MARKKKTVDLDRENDIAPGLVAKTKKRLVVGTGRSHPALAAAVTESLGTELVPTEYRTFASGEILTRFEVSIRGCDFFLIQTFGPPVNEWLMETLVMLDAAKRASAKRITVVAPYYPYSRQDKKGRGREPISARLVADLLKTAGADRVMSVDLHAAQIQGFFDGPVDHLFAKPVLLEYFERTLSPEDRAILTVVSPDTGRVRVADTWSGEPRRAARDHPQAARPERREPGHRERDRRRGRRPRLPPRRRHDRHRRHDREGGRGAQEERRAARSSSPRPTRSSAIRRPSGCRARRSTRSSSPTRSRCPTEKRFPSLTILPIAPLLARAIHEVFEDGSVTSMFDGAA